MAVALISTLSLSACSKNDQTAGSSSPSGSAVAGSSSPSSAPSGEITFPLKEKATLKVVAQRAALAPSDFNQLEIAKTLEKDTNVHVEWNTIVDTDYKEKKNLLLAGGNLPDVFYSADFTDSELIKYGQDGTIIPLNNLIDKDMPNLKALFEKRPDIKALVTAPDGNIYSLPNGEELGTGQGSIGSNPDFLYINQDWLDKLKLKMPTTLEEYHNVLKAFKTQDPNGNGKPDEVPLSYVDTFWTGDIGYLFGAFGVPDKTFQPGTNDGEHLNVDNGKVSYAAVQPGYKEALAYFHQWVAEGLISQDSFTMAKDTSQYSAKGKADPEVLGSFLWWDHTDIVGPRDKHYPIVPPFKDMVVKYNNGSQIARSGSVITKANKTPDITAKWLDYMYQPVIAAQLHWGPIGVWFDKDASGKLVQKTDLQNPGEFRQKVQLGSKPAGVITGDDFQTVVAPEARASQRIEDIKNIFVPQMQKENYPTIFFKEDELATITRLKPQIQTYTNSQRAKFLMNGVTDDEWNSYLSSLKKMGLDDLIKVYQAGYDRYLASQKK